MFDLYFYQRTKGGVEVVMWTEALAEEEVTIGIVCYLTILMEAPLHLAPGKTAEEYQNQVVLPSEKDYHEDIKDLIRSI